ncbi:MAG: superinfection exclusion B family protein [Sulfurimonas sp.]|nr:superinfection exclusion B family protein [Sulfurimonas sp.]
MININCTDILKNLKDLTPKINISILIGSSILLFCPNYCLNNLELDSLASEYKIYISFAFIISISFLLPELFVFLKVKIEERMKFNRILMTLDQLNQDQSSILEKIFYNGEVPLTFNTESVKILENNQIIEPLQVIGNYEKIYKLNKKVYKKLDKKYNKEFLTKINVLDDNEKKVLNLFFMSDYDFIDSDMINAIDRLVKYRIIFNKDNYIILSSYAKKNIKNFNGKILKKKEVELEYSKIAPEIKAKGGGTPPSL